MAEQEREAQAAAGETVEGGSLLDEIVSTTKVKPSDDSYNVAKRGLQAFIRELVRPEQAGARVHQSVVNEIISQLDERMSHQLDEILHLQDVPKLESSWRGLKLMIDRTDFRENIKVDQLNDFEDSPEVMKSGRYKHVYTAEYGQFGGEPVAAMIANYEFTAGPTDMKLLQYCASVAAMAHAPFIAGTSSKFFG